jgi:hypothetical protein
MRSTVETAWQAWQMAEPFDFLVIGTCALLSAAVVCTALARGIAGVIARARSGHDVGDWIGEGNVQPWRWL